MPANHDIYIASQENVKHNPGLSEDLKKATLAWLDKDYADEVAADKSSAKAPDVGAAAKAAAASAVESASSKAQDIASIAAGIAVAHPYLTPSEVAQRARTAYFVAVEKPAMLANLNAMPVPGTNTRGTNSDPEAPDGETFAEGVTRLFGKRPTVEEKEAEHRAAVKAQKDSEDAYARYVKTGSYAPAEPATDPRKVALDAERAHVFGMRREG